VFRCSVLHTPDKLRGFIAVVSDSDGSFPTRSEIVKRLERHGVVYGLVEERIDTLAAERIVGKRVEIANGTPPRPGKAGVLEMLVDITGAGKPRIRSDGSVDHHDLKFAVNVRKEQPLLRRIPPVPGTDGIDIFGKPVQLPPPADVVLRGGEGTMVSPEDANLLVAAQDGAIQLNRDGLLEVHTERNIPGDIDYSTGNVTFAGDIRIGGTVRAGFTVKADGTLFIGGSVEEATVVAGGDLTITGGASGSGKGHLESEGSITVKYCENFLLKSGGSITVKEDVIHCTAIVRDVFKARSIVGGSITAGKMCCADNVGNTAEVKTCIEMEGHFAARTARDQAIKKMTVTMTGLGNCKEEMYRLVRDSMDDTGTLDADTKARLDELVAQRKGLMAESGALQDQVEKLDEMIAHFDDPLIRVRNLFPNTIIKYGQLERLIKEKQSNVVIRCTGESFEFSTG